MVKSRHKQTQLTKEKALVQALLDAGPDSIIIIEPTGQIRAGNEIAAKKLGKNLNKLVGFCLYDLLPAEVAGTRKEKFEEAINTGLPVRFEDKHTGLFFENCIYPVRDGSAINALVVYERDITAIKQAEAAQSWHDCEITTALEKSTEISCRFLPDGTLTFVSDSYCRYLDKTPAQLLGRSFLSLIPEPERTKTQEHLTSLSEENPVKIIQNRLVKPNGEIKIQLWANRAIFDERGKLIEYQSVGQDITFRMQTEAALREKQRLLERIADATPSIIYLYDLVENRNVYSNAAPVKILGYTAAQIQTMGATFFPTLMHPEDLAKLPAKVEQFAVAKEGEIVECEYRMKHANGDWRWLYSRDTVFTHTAGGRPQLILGIAEDITERKQSEIELQESRRMLQLVIDNIPQAIFWKDRQSVYLGCNLKFALYAGLSAVGNIAGKTDYDLPWKKEEADFFRKWDLRVMETDAPEYHIIEPQLQADGKQAWLDTNKVPLHDASGRVVGVLGTYEDITERKRIEEALQASEERFRLLVEGVKDYAIYMLDTCGFIISWNAGAERIKGYRSDEILGRHFSGFYELQDRQWGKAEWQLNTCARSGRFEDEGWRVRKDGSRFWASVVITALTDELGQLRGFATIVRDITDRRQAEEALQKANEVLGIKVEVQTTELRVAIEQLHHEIGKRTHAEAEVRKSQQKYRSVIDNLKEVIFQTDEAGFWTFLNPAWTEITGFTLEESLGKLFLDFVHPEDLLRNADLFQPLIQRQKEECRYEVRYLTKYKNPSFSSPFNKSSSLSPPFLGETEAGGYRWLEVFARVTLDDRGQVSGTAGTLNDITERKQTEAALRESDERFRRAFEDVATGMALVGLDGRYLQVNRALCEMLGYSEAELMATTFQVLTHPADLQISLKLHQQLESRKVRCQQIEKRYLHKDGHTVWAQLTRSLMCDKEGEPLYYVSQIQDITERKLAEAALRESEAIFRQLAENVDEVFWLLSPDFSQMLYVSPMYQHIWGRPCAQVYNSPRSWLDAVHPEDRERVILALEASNSKLKLSDSTEILLNEEYRIIRPDGANRWIWDRSFPVRNEAGEIYRLCRVAKDITGRKQAEEELRKALVKERELSELRSRFVTMVSHEFRTPLSTILSSADLLEYYFEAWPIEKTEKKLQHLTRIQSAAVNMTQLLNDVLVIGRNDAGKVSFKPAWLDLEGFCRDLVEEFQISASNSHTLNFFVRTYPERTFHQASETRKCTEAWVDEKLLRQIFSNLLSNALKYSPVGGEIQFKLACQKSVAIFQIQDAGIGIPPKDQRRLFEAFHRAENVGEIPGTGLGLAIVKRAVDIHSGHIKFKSEVGVGTTFTVALPLTNQSKSDEEDSSD